MCCPSQTTKETQQIIYDGMYFQQQRPRLEQTPHMEPSMLGWGSALCVMLPGDGLHRLHPQFKNAAASDPLARPYVKQQTGEIDMCLPRWCDLDTFPAYLSCSGCRGCFRGRLRCLMPGFEFGTERLSSRTLHERLKHFRTHICIFLCFPV